MLDHNLLCKKIKIFSKKLKNRGFNLNTEELQILSERHKILQTKIENLHAKRNSQSKFIGKMIACGKNVELLRSEVNKIGKELDKARSELEILRSKIHDFVMIIPNLPDDSVPVGKNESYNIEIKRWSTPRVFNFNIRDHVTLGVMHNWLDFAASVTLSGSRFVVMKGQVARLHRALIQFMLDLHTVQHGYNETYIPYLVKYDTLYGTGQLPKFSDDLFHVKKMKGEESEKSYALIPTAEVPLTNLVRNKILDEEDLPIKLTAHSPCFRSEVGSYGRDAHGLIRTHQFEKVEMVQVVRPEDSMSALEEMTNHAEKVLELLELPYRRMFLCTGDMGFGACKSYDLEVWIPSQSMYREISSCSNMWDFQARRMKARYRRKKDRKTCLVHTLNGSGLAVGRTLVAILENYQQEDGRVEIPKALQIYMNGHQYIG